MKMILNLQSRVGNDVKVLTTNTPTHLPGSVHLIDVVDHLTGQGSEERPGHTHRQAGSQQEKGCTPHSVYKTRKGRHTYLLHYKL